MVPETIYLATAVMAFLMGLMLGILAEIGLRGRE
jgi:hypothetical protein